MVSRRRRRGRLRCNPAPPDRSPLGELGLVVSAGLIELRLGQIAGAAENSAAKIGTGEVRVLELGILELGIAKIGVAKIGAGQLRIAESRVHKE